jgi:hypothetical protein
MAHQNHASNIKALGTHILTAVAQFQKHIEHSMQHGHDAAMALPPTATREEVITAALSDFHMGHAETTTFLAKAKTAL